MRTWNPWTDEIAEDNAQMRDWAADLALEGFPVLFSSSDYPTTLLDGTGLVWATASFVTNGCTMVVHVEGDDGGDLYTEMLVDGLGGATKAADETTKHYREGATPVA